MFIHNPRNSLVGLAYISYQELGATKVITKSNGDISFKGLLMPRAARDGTPYFTIVADELIPVERADWYARVWDFIVKGDLPRTIPGEFGTGTILTAARSAVNRSHYGCLESYYGDEYKLGVPNPFNLRLDIGDVVYLGNAEDKQILPFEDAIARF